VQRERLLKRGMAADQIDRRIASQMPLEEKCRRADVVIWNDGDLDGLAAQVEKVAAEL
jgi:dephospho-CoA kinase